MSDWAEEKAREFLSRSFGWRGGYPRALPKSLAALLREVRDEWVRAEWVKAMKEAQSRFDKMWKANEGETHDLNKGASIACDEILHRMGLEMVILARDFRALLEENERLKADLAVCDGHGYLRERIEALEAWAREAMELLQTQEEIIEIDEEGAVKDRRAEVLAKASELEIKT